MHSYLLRLEPKSWDLLFKIIITISGSTWIYLVTLHFPYFLSIGTCQDPNSLLSLNRLKWEKFPEIQPKLLPHNSFIVLGDGPAVSRHNLALTPDYPLKLQVSKGHLLVLSHPKLSNLLHIRSIDALYWLPPAAFACNTDLSI